MRIRFIFLMLFTLTLLSACTSGTDARVQAAIAETSMASAGAGMNTVSDADAAGIARTINDGEIQMAQLALTAASSQQVRDFAQMLINDHTAANAQLQQRGYGRFENAVTQVLNADVTRRMAMLRGLSGVDFDRAFLGAQVDMHQTALNTIRTTLQPSASDEALRGILTTMRMSVEQHLQHARTMHTGMGQ